MARLAPAATRPGQTSRAERVAGLLRERVMRGELLPGTPLREDAVAGSVGVSRNTVREAFRTLAREGLVTHHMHRGVVVTHRSPEDVEDVFRARRLLELAAIEAAEGAGPAELRDLSRAGEEGSPDSDVEAELLFHRELVRLLRSERLQALFDTMLVELRLVLTTAAGESSGFARLAASHRDICGLIESGQIDRAKDLMRAHLDDTEELVLRIVRAGRAASA